MPLSLKREIERAAKKRGWSISSEGAHRLQQSFELQEMLKAVLAAVAAIKEGMAALARIKEGKNK